MKRFWHHDAPSSPANSCLPVRGQRPPVAHAVVGRIAARTIRPAAFMLLATGLAFAVQAKAANLLFASGFEGTTALSPIAPLDCWSTGCWQDITGTDASIPPGLAWPSNVWG